MGSRERKRKRRGQTIGPSGTCLNWLATLPLSAAGKRSEGQESTSSGGRTGSRKRVCAAAATSIQGIDEINGDFRWALAKGSVEVTVGGSGRRQGAAAGSTAPGTCSRLCKDAFFRRWLKILATGEGASRGGVDGSGGGASHVSAAGVQRFRTYLECKRNPHEKRALRNTSMDRSSEEARSVEFEPSQSSSSPSLESPVPPSVSTNADRGCASLEGGGDHVVGATSAAGQGSWRDAARAGWLGKPLAAWAGAPEAYDDFSLP